MLDDLKYIHQRDGQDALGIAEKQWQQLLHSFGLSAKSYELNDVANIVYAGMGGSALAAYLSKTWPGYKLPFEIVRQYHIPAYVGPQTLFIADSYSGDTEETLAALAEAEKAAARIMTIASGGKLAEIAQAKNYPLLLLPKVVEPRYGVLASLRAIVEILAAAGQLDKAKAVAELASATEFLKQAVQAWLPTVPSDQNPAKKLAMELAGKSIAVYAGPLLAPVAYKWKINFNENAKNVAWWNELPEFDHNELTGWTGQPVEKPYAIINLLSAFEHPRIRRRIEVAEKLLSGRRPSAHNIEALGTSLLEHLLWCVAYGDFVSIYLALLNNQNPAPVDLVEKFKTELNK
ncbi:hypothetical protein HY380_02160 [Candidatus Saccharibacteria bacterium]|nr:hypothetical protein [Candidatus Saccharibacteria bacterium]